MTAVRWKTMILGLALLVTAACGDDPVEPIATVEVEDVTFAPQLGVDLAEMKRLESGVYVRDMSVPDSLAPDVRPLYYIWVTYDGWLNDGTHFAQQEEFPSLRIGAGEVISGWDLGLIGALKGSTRRLVIPPARGYGSAGGAVIPPNAVLVFDVTIDSIGPPEG